MPIAEAGEFLVGPSPGLVVWAGLLLLFVPVCGVITALKGRWGWVAIGWFTGGLIWILTAPLLAALPDSRWARWRSGRALRRRGSLAATE